MKVLTQAPHKGRKWIRAERAGYDLRGHRPPDLHFLAVPLLWVRPGWWRVVFNRETLSHSLFLVY